MTIRCSGVSLPTDAQGNAIPIAARIVTQDGTGTPVVSPLTVSSVVLELVPPDNATSLFIKATGADMRYGDNNTLDGTAGDGYGLMADGDQLFIPVACGESVFVLRDAAVDVEANFHFETL